MHGAGISAVSVQERTREGFWLSLNGERLFLAFADFPWFENASPSQLHGVRLPADGHLYWPELDVDLSVASIRDPASFPLVAAGGR